MVKAKCIFASSKDLYSEKLYSVLGVTLLVVSMLGIPWL